VLVEALASAAQCDVMPKFVAQAATLTLLRQMAVGRDNAGLRSDQTMQEQPLVHDRQVTGEAKSTPAFCAKAWREPGMRAWFRRIAQGLQP